MTWDFQTCIGNPDALEIPEPPPEHLQHAAGAASEANVDHNSGDSGGGSGNGGDGDSSIVNNLEEMMAWPQHFWSTWVDGRKDERHED